MMRFWIVVDGFNKKIELPDELADRFYKRLTKKYCKDNAGNDSFTVAHNGAKAFVVKRVTEAEKKSKSPKRLTRGKKRQPSPTLLRNLNRNCKRQKPNAT